MKKLFITLSIFYPLSFWIMAIVCYKLVTPKSVAGQYIIIQAPNYISLYWGVIGGPLLVILSLISTMMNHENWRTKKGAMLVITWTILSLLAGFVLFFKSL